MELKLKTLVDEKALKQKIKELADKINSEYNEHEPIVAICVLKGAVMFFTELVQHLKMPIRMEFVSLSSYGSSKISSGKVSALNISLPPLENEKVLVVEDIMDTGLTLNFLIDYLKSKCKVKDVKLAVMFNKECARKYPLEPDYAAFEVDNKFIVGFGLDCDELYRNIPYIGYVEN